MQIELLESLAANFATNEYRLLVIDSVMSLYRTDFVGRGELSERQQALGAFLRRATQMAEEFNLAVLMVHIFPFYRISRILTRNRQTKSCQTPVPVLCSQELTVASLLVGMFLLTLLQPDFFLGRDEVRNELPRLLIPQVSEGSCE